VAGPLRTPAPTTPRKAPFPHVGLYWQATPDVRRHGWPLLTSVMNDTVHAMTATVRAIPSSATHTTQSEQGPNHSRKTYTYYAAERRRTGSTLCSAELLREVPEKLLVETTRSQLLRDAHAVINNSKQSTTIHHVCERMPYTEKDAQHYSTVAQLCIPPLPLPLSTIKGGRGCLFYTRYNKPHQNTCMLSGYTNHSHQGLGT
jgi:hypothetical protein